MEFEMVELPREQDRDEQERTRREKRRAFRWTALDEDEGDEEPDEQDRALFIPEEDED